LIYAFLSPKTIDNDLQLSPTKDVAEAYTEKGEKVAKEEREKV
jgi:hypothetical protein